jgi:hypothetical protein
MCLRYLGAKYWTSWALPVTLYCLLALLTSPTQEGEKAVKNQDWVKTLVDAFLLSRLEKEDWL